MRTMPTRMDRDDPTPTDPRDWRPQFARQTTRPAAVPNPIVEPDWDGIHVLAHFELHGPDGEPHVELIDAVGEDASTVDAAVTRALAAAVMAVDAVIDGVLTEQATRSGIGAAIISHVDMPKTGLLLRRNVGLEVDAKAVAPGEKLAFVAVDLLQLDGQPLLDLPLLERKRLLDGLLEQSDLVRVSPFTRPPLGPWLNSWKSAGFKGALLKASNSRYRPNSLTTEWTAVSKIHGR